MHISIVRKPQLPQPGRYFWVTRSKVCLNKEGPKTTDFLGPGISVAARNAAGLGSFVDIEAGVPSVASNVLTAALPALTQVRTAVQPPEPPHALELCCAEAENVHLRPVSAFACLSMMLWQCSENLQPGGCRRAMTVEHQCSTISSRLLR